MNEQDLLWEFTKTVNGKRERKSKIALPRKNDKQVIKIPIQGKRGQFRYAIEKSRETRAWEKNLANMLAELSPMRFDPAQPHFRRGVWFCEIAVMTPSVLHQLSPRKGDRTDKVDVEDLLNLDDDSCTESIRDGLETVGLLDDDARFRGTNSTSLYRWQGHALWVKCSMVQDILPAFLSGRVAPELERYAVSPHARNRSFS